MENTPKDPVTIAEAASILNRGRSTLNRACAEGRLPFVMVDGIRKISVEDAKDLFDSAVRGAFALQHGHLPKVERYKWNTLDEPGEFCWIEKGELKIDHDYQRDKLNENRINQMAANWSWVLCGALSIAERNEEWWVVDGQHRKRAADKRHDITKLPCLVFPSTSQPIEAAQFVALNSQKTAVASVDRFKAMIVAGDECACGVKELLESTGHRVGLQSSVKVIACVMCVWKLYKQDAALLRSLWPLIADVHASYHITDTVIRALWGTELKARSKGLSLREPPFRSSLIQAGGAVLHAEIRREIQITGKSGERIETAAVIKWLNRQRLGTKYKLAV